MAKDYFKENNIAFTDFDVAGNPDKRKELVDKSGQLGVPVIIIDNDMVIGFNKPVISKLLGLAS